MDHLLANVQIVVPSSKRFVPVTLPYAYQAVLPVERVDTGVVGQIVADTEQFLENLDEKHASRIRAYEQWAADTEHRNKMEKRRIAPGYLDEEKHILEPSGHNADSTTGIPEAPDPL